jgi:hypothetical protein
LSQASSDNQNSHLDAFEQEMKKRSSLDDVTFTSTLQSQRDDDDDEDDLPTTQHESEYISMQELNPASPDNSYGTEAESQNRDVESTQQNYHTEEPTIANHAGYVYARQFSSTVRKTIPSSPMYLTPHKSKYTEHVGKPRNNICDEPSVADVPDDEQSPQSSVESNAASIDDNKEADRTNLTTPMSIGSKSTTKSRDTLYSQGTSSFAMRGARELLKKNREERLAVMAKRKAVKTPPVKTPNDDQQFNASDEFNDPEPEPQKEVKPLYSHRRSRSITPNKKRFQAASSPSTSPVKKPQSPAPVSPSFVPPKTPPSTAPKALNKSADFSSPMSDVSASSSGWAEDDKDARRALILKMAKHRMRSKKEVRAS